MAHYVVDFFRSIYHRLSSIGSISGGLPGSYNGENKDDASNNSSDVQMVSVSKELYSLVFHCLWTLGGIKHAEALFMDE